MKILLIRHGESTADIMNVHEGRADFPLTEKGELQAARLAEHLKTNYDIDALLASPLKRSKKTAEALSENIGKKINFHAELMEMDNGVLAGMNREEAKIKYPMPKNGRRIHDKIEGGESEIQFRMRIEHFVSFMLEAYGHHETVAVVAHGGSISRIIQSLLKLPIGEYGFVTDDTGFHLLEIKNSKTLVHFMNSTIHLKSGE